MSTTFKLLFSLILIPQRIFGVWLFYFISSSLFSTELSAKTVLFVVLQSLGVQLITLFAMKTEMMQEMLKGTDVSVPVWFILSGFFADLLFVTIDLLI
jgi:hypothetical protein